MADFETTVYSDQENTEVWASAITPLDEDWTEIHSSIDSFMEFILNLQYPNITIFFHNLKFDGSFILYYLLTNKRFKPFTETVDGVERLRNDFSRHGKSGNFTYLISDKGIWYNIELKYRGKNIIFRDSLKLLPFSVAEIAKAFNTSVKKLEIEYKGKRSANGYISEKEKQYIANDVQIPKEALNILFSEGMKKFTIGSNAIADYKEVSCFMKGEWRLMFPDLSQEQCPIEGFRHVDDYIRKSYKGGWCYVKPDSSNILFNKGCTADVNSLYPYVMTSESGSQYPYGKPLGWFTGSIPKEMYKTVSINGETYGDRFYYYFVRFKCRFRLKRGYLPTVQIKGSMLYRGNEWLTTSDYIDPEGNPHRYIKNFTGKTVECKPTITMTCTDYELFLKHYNVYDLEVLDGCYFPASKGLFDAYVHKWGKRKEVDKGAKRTIDKLMLNSSYGKFGTSDDSSYKVMEATESGLKSHIIEEHEKTVLYIPIGSAITSYARFYTITHAQMNYKNFIYADTDSIHCKCDKQDLINIEQHPTKFGAWKIENEWDSGIFVRQKTYIEHTIKSDGEPVTPYYLVKCAGMGKSAKNNLINKLENNELTLKDFKVGLKIKGNLKAKLIKGGTILQDMEYVMR